MWSTLEASLWHVQQGVRTSLDLCMDGPYKFNNNTRCCREAIPKSFENTGGSAETALPTRPKFVDILKDHYQPGLAEVPWQEGKGGTQLMPCTAMAGFARIKRPS